MKSLIFVFAIGFGFASLSTMAAPVDGQTKEVQKTAHVKKKKTKKKAALAKKGSSAELQTDVKFDDSVLHGQYQTPTEALAKVENEKGLNDLIGVRKHFKDRLNTASEQE